MVFSNRHSAHFRHIPTSWPEFFSIAQSRIALQTLQLSRPRATLLIDNFSATDWFNINEDNALCLRRLWNWRYRMVRYGRFDPNFRYDWRKFLKSLPLMNRNYLSEDVFRITPCESETVIPRGENCQTVNCQTVNCQTANCQTANCQTANCQTNR